MLEGLGARLKAVSPLAVLARGYVPVVAVAGQPLTRAAEVRAGERLRLGDGEVGAPVDATRKNL